MPIGKCPGQDNRNWRSEDVFDAPCPRCGRALEFWKSEPSRRCTGCGQRVPNPQFNAGCAAWCQFAADCLGLTPGAGDSSLADRLIAELRSTHRQDRVSHALDVLDYAEKILPSESADPLVVKAGAILCGLGAGPGDGRPETGDPPAVRALLERLGVDSDRIERIACILAGGRAGGEVASKEFDIVRDALRLAEWPGQATGGGDGPGEAGPTEALRTQAAKAIATRQELKQRRPPSPQSPRG